MTVSKEIAKIIVKNNGFYPGDPQCFCVAEYENSFHGGIDYHVSYSEADLHNLSNFHTFIILWKRDYGITPAGEKFLRE